MNHKPVTFPWIWSDLCSSIGTYHSKAQAKAAINAEPEGPNGKHRVVRCPLHSHTIKTPVFHLTDAPTGRHRQTGRR